MRKLAVILAVVISGCASSGQYDPAVAQRVAADGRCVLQLAIDGVSIYGNPPAGSAITAAHIVNTVEHATTMTQTAADACGPTLQYVNYDIKALKAKVDAWKAAHKR